MPERETDPTADLHALQAALSRLLETAVSSRAIAMDQAKRVMATKGER